VIVSSLGASFNIRAVGTISDCKSQNFCIRDPQGQERTVRMTLYLLTLQPELHQRSMKKKEKKEKKEKKKKKKKKNISHRLRSVAC